MAENGILSSLFGGAAKEVQIVAPPAKPKPVEEPKRFDIERAKRGEGMFPPQEQLFVNTARSSGHLTNIALAALIDPGGYSLEHIQRLWESGDITDRSTYIVVTHGLLPPRDVLRYVYSAELLNAAIPGMPAPADKEEATLTTELTQTFTVTVPPGFRVYVFCSGLSLAEGHALPAALASGAACLSVHVQRHSVGQHKADNSVEHTFSFAQRLCLRGAPLDAVPPGVMRFIARAELVRI
jgi:hypothetical protein